MHSIYIPFIREPVATGLSADESLELARYAEQLFPGECFQIVREN